MKLELKHLAGYLPYNLRFKDTYAGDVGTYQLSAHSLSHWEHGHIKPFYPILRPLSDLTKDEFYHLWSHETDFESIVKFTESDIETIESYKFSLSFWNGMHENHFDIYGLIDSNLAIDINTLNTL